MEKKKHISIVATWLEASAPSPDQASLVSQIKVKQFREDGRLYLKWSPTTAYNGSWIWRDMMASEKSKKFER